jgi:hypothetical protein
MKWLGLLAAAIILLVAIWWVTGRSAPPSPRHSLELPSRASTKEDLIRASHQFLNWDPIASSPEEGIELLRLLHDRLSEDEWGPVVVGAFHGWHLLRRVPGSHSALEPISASLVGRFARWGGPIEIEELYRTGKTAEYWKALVQAAFRREADREIGKSGYHASSLAVIVEVLLKHGDYEQAGELLGRIRFREDVNDGGRRPAGARSQALAHYFYARDRKPELPALFELWRVSESEAMLRQILEDAGNLLVKEALAAWDAGKVVAVIGPTSDREGAAEFWKAVLLRHIGPEDSRYMKSEAIGSFAQAIGWQFKESSFESDLWAKLAEDEKGKEPHLVMWRFECLKRAALSAPSDDRRLELTKAVAAGLSTNRTAAVGRQMVEEILAKTQAEGPKEKIRAMVVDLRAKEAVDRARQAEEHAMQEAESVKQAESRAKLGAAASGIPASTRSNE